MEARKEAPSLEGALSFSRGQPSGCPAEAPQLPRIDALRGSCTCRAGDGLSSHVNSERDPLCQIPAAPWACAFDLQIVHPSKLVDGGTPVQQGQERDTAWLIDRANGFIVFIVVHLQ